MTHPHAIGYPLHRDWPTDDPNRQQKLELQSSRLHLGTLMGKISRLRERLSLEISLVKEELAKDCHNTRKVTQVIHGLLACRIASFAVVVTGIALICFGFIEYSKKSEYTLYGLAAFLTGLGCAHLAKRISRSVLASPTAELMLAHRSLHNYTDFCEDEKLEISEILRRENTPLSTMTRMEGVISLRFRFVELKVAETREIIAKNMTPPQAALEILPIHLEEA
jgi:hypothetical protein